MSKDQSQQPPAATGVATTKPLALGAPSQATPVYGAAPTSPIGGPGSSVGNTNLGATPWAGQSGGQANPIGGNPVAASTGAFNFGGNSTPPPQAQPQAAPAQAPQSGNAWSFDEMQRQQSQPGFYTNQAAQPQQTNVQAPQSATEQTAGGYQPPPGTDQLSQQLQTSFGGIQNSLNNSNLPPLQSGADLMKMLTDSRNAAYSNATGYLDPQFNQQESALKSQLTNQGIPQNSEAWNKAMGDFSRQKQFAYQQAQSNAVSQGNAAQNQLFGQGLAANQNQFGQNLAGGQFANSAQGQLAQQLLQQMGYGTQYGIASMGNQLGNRSLDEQINQNNFANSMGMRQQDINELLLQQQNPLQMYNALMGGNSVQTPNFSQTPGTNMAGTDIAGIRNSALGQQNNVYNAQVGAANSGNSALMNTAATAAAAFMFF